MFDFEAAANNMKRVVGGIADEQLGNKTPCDGTNVAGVLDHVAGLAMGFTMAATKESIGNSEAPGVGNTELDPKWRVAIPQRLDELVDAWRHPEAWDGNTEAGGVVMPAEAIAAVAMDELVMHAWDLAMGTGQPFECDETSAQIALSFAAESAKPEFAEQRSAIFGPIVDVSDDAPVLHQALGLTGRNPNWIP